MDVVIIATKGCSHCQNIVKELDGMGIKHSILYVEDDPEYARVLGIRQSPNLVIDGDVVFSRQPTRQELRENFNC